MTRPRAPLLSRYLSAKRCLAAVHAVHEVAITLTRQKHHIIWVSKALKMAQRPCKITWISGHTKLSMWLLLAISPNFHGRETSKCSKMLKRTKRLHNVARPSALHVDHNHGIVFASDYAWQLLHHPQEALTQSSTPMPRVCPF